MIKIMLHNKCLNVYLIWAIWAVLFIGCKRPEDIITSYGKETTEKRQVGAFNSIIAGEKFDIELRQDSAREGEVEMTAGENVIDGYVTEVKDGELKIENKNKFNWVRKLKVRQRVVVYFKIINKIQINGSAKFTCKDTIKQKVFSISHDGLENAEFTVLINNMDFKGTNTGGVILKGRSYIFSVSVDNISFVDCKGMQTDDTYITSFSKADNYVEADKKLNVTLFGSGNVYYSINPANVLILEERGQGKIIKK